MGKYSHLSLTSLAALGGGKLRADVKAELEWEREVEKLDGAVEAMSLILHRPGKGPHGVVAYGKERIVKIDRNPEGVKKGYVKIYLVGGKVATLPKDQLKRNVVKESLEEAQVFIRKGSGTDWRKPEGAIELVDKKTGKPVGQHFRTPDEAKKYAEKNKMQIVKEGKKGYTPLLNRLEQRMKKEAGKGNLKDASLIADLKKKIEKMRSGDIQEGTGHKLIIKSLDDAQATCSCGKWNFSQTGKATKVEIAKEWKKHNQGIKESLEEGKHLAHKDFQKLSPKEKMDAIAKNIVQGVSEEELAKIKKALAKKESLEETATYPVKLKAGMPEIKHGDKVTVLVRAGSAHGGQDWKEKTGKAVMRSPKVGGWALNFGGAHGTPGLASPKNIVAVNGKRCIKESLEEGKGHAVITKGAKSCSMRMGNQTASEPGSPEKAVSKLKTLAKKWGAGSVEVIPGGYITKEGIGEEIMKAPGTGTSVAAKTQGYIKSIVDRKPQTAAELEKLLRDVPHDFLDGVRKEVQKRTRLSFKETEVKGLVGRRSSFLQHCKACGIDIHPGAHFFEIAFHREYGVICNSCELDGKKVVLEGFMEIDKIMTVTEASKGMLMHKLGKETHLAHPSAPKTICGRPLTPVRAGATATFKPGDITCHTCQSRVGQTERPKGGGLKREKEPKYPKRQR